MRKRIIVLLVILMIVLANITVVEAATATATLTPNKSIVKVGETFTVTLRISCEDGINGIDTLYSYDDDKLELISATVKDTTNWSSLGSDKQITLICNSTSSIKVADVYVLTFKVKDNVTAGTNTEIMVERILVDSDAETDSEATIDSFNTYITVEGETGENNKPSTGEGTEQGGTTTEEKPGTEQDESTTEEKPKTEQNTSTIISTENKDNTITSETQLPKTGTTATTMVIIAIIGVLSSIAFIAYKKYNKYKEI